MRGARVGSSVEDAGSKTWDCSGATVLRHHLGGQRVRRHALSELGATARAIAETLVRKTFRFPLRRTPIAVTDKGNAVRKAALSHREGR